MAKKTRTQRRIDRLIAATSEVEESRSTDAGPGHSPQVDQGQAKSTGDVKADQRLQNAAMYGMDINHPSTVDLKTAHCPAQPATDGEKAELIIQYAELFCAHIDKKFAATSNRVELLNRQVMETVRRSKCTDIRKFHEFYELWYPKRLQDTPDMINKVGVELNDFDVVQDWWWDRCPEVLTPNGRRAFVVDVFERIKDEMGVLELYGSIDALFKEYTHN